MLKRGFYTHEPGDEIADKFDLFAGKLVGHAGRSLDIKEHGEALSLDVTPLIWDCDGEPRFAGLVIVREDLLDCPERIEKLRFALKDLVDNRLDLEIKSIIEKESDNA